MHCCKYASICSRYRYAIQYSIISSCFGTYTNRNRRESTKGLVRQFQKSKSIKACMWWLWKRKAENSVFCLTTRPRICLLKMNLSIWTLLLKTNVSSFTYYTILHIFILSSKTSCSKQPLLSIFIIQSNYTSSDCFSISISYSVAYRSHIEVVLPFQRMIDSGGDADVIFFDIQLTWVIQAWLRGGFRRVLIENSVRL